MPTNRLEYVLHRCRNATEWCISLFHIEIIAQKQVKYPASAGIFNSHPIETMKVHQMSEPISSTAAGVIGWKFIGGLAGLGAFGAALATIVVMCVMRPRNSQEWAVGLISTVMSSLGGGCATIEYLGIQHWANSPFGLVAMMSLVFACGLPGWAIVRWIFNYIQKTQDKDIKEIVTDLRGVQ